jgi:hypothetical protein
MHTVPARTDGSRLPEDTATLRSDPSAGRLFEASAGERRKTRRASGVSSPANTISCDQ